MRVLRVARVARGEKYSRLSDARGNARVGTAERETGGIDCDAALGTWPIRDRRLCLYVLPAPTEAARANAPE